MQQKSATGFWLLLPYKSNAPVPGLGTPSPGEGHKRVGHAYWLWRYGYRLFAAAAQLLPHKSNAPVPGLETNQSGEGHKRMGHGNITTDDKHL
ncbi:hypothetical protein [Sphingobacterium griseoflavum]|uniref:hypothetical protein n=1 Tax=Sphingobacterium griseoflavum TaxID=1474952 RepID=UPI00363A4A92